MPIKGKKILNLFLLVLLTTFTTNSFFYFHTKESNDTSALKNIKTELNSTNFLKSPLFHQNKLKDINNFFSNYKPQSENINSNYLAYLSGQFNLENQQLHLYSLNKVIRTLNLQKVSINTICRYNI
jgi:hypothetical protein